MLGAVRPGGRVAPLKEVVIDLGDAASSRLSGAPHDWLEVGERICLSRVLRHLIAQPPVNLSGSFTQHRCKLGAYIELRGETNASLVFGPDDVRGVNNLKLLMPTKADINGRDLSKFQIVYPGEFVFNHRTSRNGSKFSIAYNDGEKAVICTEDYVVFRIKEDAKEVLAAEWLYMFFNRSEFDRYVITNSWGSSTEFYNWEDLCEVELDLPPFSVQRQYVAIYKSMVANQKSYERGLEDLKLVCDGYIEDLRRKLPCEKIGPFISEINERNSTLQIDNVQGVNSSGNFGETKANTVGLDFRNYKIVKPGQFAYNPSRINLGSIALPWHSWPGSLPFAALMSHRLDLPPLS